MAQVTPVVSERERGVSALARTLVAAARTWGLYPPDHPAVRASIERLGASISEAGGSGAIGFGITPDTLLLDGLPLDASGPVAEAAGWLHGHDVLHIAFDRDTPAEAMESLLRLFAEDPISVRQAGGPAVRWARAGHPSVRIEQIDLAGLLEDPDDTPSASRRDDLWRAIVQAVLDRRRGLDASMQQRLLEIAGDVPAIAALAEDLMAPNCSIDGSPMLTSQAAAVTAAYRHLLGIIDVMAPDRRAEVLQNLAGATSSLAPGVVMEMFSLADGEQPRMAAASADAVVSRAVADALDDGQVAQLLATTLALDGRASNRLAAVFSTIAPDDSRRQRVLTMAREALRGSELARSADFQTLWRATEELLLAYSEKPFVSADYRDALDGISGRAERMAADVPEDVAALIATLDQDNVRCLSVTLLLDLMHLERGEARAQELAGDAGAACEDLLLAGDYESAATVARALAARAAEAGSPAATAARDALDTLASTAPFREAAGDLESMDEDAAETFGGLCRAIGAAATEGLLPLLDVDAHTSGRERAAGLIRGFGREAARRIAPLARSPHWYAQRNAAELLGEIGSPDGVPLLQPLLRGTDPRVLRMAVRALSTIDDPSAARCVQTVLRAATGEQREAVVAALVEERDPRVVPLLGRMLDESDALGADHGLVLQTLGAVGSVGGDAAIPSVERVMRERRWFAGGKVRRIVEASIRALRQIGTPAARAALTRAATGDRVLRRAVAGSGSPS